MVDGTGMCGGCRVLVGGQAKFACVDGPEFDAHQVDFDVLAQRNAMYRAAERDSMERFEQHPQQDLERIEHQCRLAERHPELDTIMTNPLKPKDRVKLPRQEMPAQPTDVRRHDFDEVNLGLSVIQAHSEASRCPECSHPHCVEGCPVGVKVKEFVELIYDGDYLGAAAKIREDNVLPAVTGRVCPQEHQCEGKCILGKRFAPLGIGYLERFVADYEHSQGKIALPPKAPATGKRVAIVGSGPAGLSAAGDLVLKGHEVTVFEALHEPGGVLIYGIPEFGLPKAIVRQEIDNLRTMGVRFETNVVIGKTITIDELLGEEGFDAVFIATGAGLPKFLGVPGEHLAGVYSANEFLTRVNLMSANKFPDYDEPVYDCRDRVVAVVGTGNTAMDARFPSSDRSTNCRSIWRSSRWARVPIPWFNERHRI